MPFVVILELAWSVRDADRRRNWQECLCNLWPEQHMVVRPHREFGWKMLLKNSECGIHDLRTRGNIDTELSRIKNAKGSLFVNTNHAGVDSLQI